MSSSAPSRSSGPLRTTKKNARGQRTDPGWQHATEYIEPETEENQGSSDPSGAKKGEGKNSNSKKIKCNYCLKVYSGGINRLKNHLGHTHNNVEPCPLVPNDVREFFRNLLRSFALEVESKKRRLHDIGDEEEEEERGLQMQKNHKGKGPLDRIFTKTNRTVQSTMNQMYKKEERELVCQQIARFLYTSAIPFNVVNNPEFAVMVDKISKFGSGLKPPSFHEVRVKFLDKEVSVVKQMIEEHKLEWRKTGCTIMSDGWTDQKKRTLCNFLVNSPKGSVFLKSIDASDVSKTADKIFKMLDDVVELIGEENVVQVVSDNAANYKAAGEMLMAKRKRLYWTPCAAHCIDLMLEDFDKKLSVHSTTIESAKRITTFIYSRTLLHSWLKEFTQGKELIRPGATRFATSYLTLRSLNEQKGPLFAMFASDKWKSSRFASLAEGRHVENIVLDSRRGFWNDVTTCLKASLPLVKVLRLVDSDQPAMGFIYEAMDQAKRRIKENFKDVERQFKPIWDIIDLRWESQLHKPLHAAAYYLNPRFHYGPDFQGVAGIKIGLYDCLSRMIHDPEEKVKIDMQMDDFKNAKGLFGLPTAIMTRSKKSPADWWDSYGDECPELKRFAIRILSLTCSSSGCERNWSAFEMVHTKKRNRLAQQKLNDLVFVMYNQKLKQRQQQKRDPEAHLFELEISSDDEWITEQEDHEILDAINRVDDEQSFENDEGTSRGDTLGTVGSSAFVGSNQHDNVGGFETDSFEEGDHEIGSIRQFGSRDGDDGNYGYED